MDKQEILQGVIEKIQQEIQDAEQSFESTRNAAIEAPGAMQSHSDTTKFQMGQLAGKIQNSIYEKRLAIKTIQNIIDSDLSPDSDIDKIKVGSLVEILNESKISEFYYILPVGGGTKITCKNKIVSVITPQTPLATALIGKQKKDAVKLQTGYMQRELTITNVQ